MASSTDSAVFSSIAVAFCGGLAPEFQHSTHTSRLARVFEPQTFKLLDGLDDVLLDRLLQLFRQLRNRLDWKI